ncbi:MAG: antiviral reverse transcriptase Drt2 [Alphaproteobacteria bacterium]
MGEAFARPKGEAVDDDKGEFAQSEQALASGRQVFKQHRAVSAAIATSVADNVEAVAGSRRNIVVMAAGGTEGLNGTLPRRVTVGDLKPRSYHHFDEPLTREDLAQFVVDRDLVAKNAFLPLLGYKKLRRKIDFSVFPPLVAEKERNIRFAGHQDSAIYSAYSALIGEDYENVLSVRHLGGAVLAYRGGIGYNVGFAKSLFDEIRRLKDCTVICFDVSKFFDSLDHKILKARLLDVLHVCSLPNDIFKIYERITKFEYVEIDELKEVIKSYGKNRICSIEDFREKVRPLIRRNKFAAGIPQGTPVSGLFANIYMIQFDSAMQSLVDSVGGSYRRYSDDIAVVIRSGDQESLVKSKVSELLLDQKLSLNGDKTTVSRFSFYDGRIHCSDKRLQYLGFTFDGERILIRPESIKAFYARMKVNIRRYVRAASRSGIPSNRLRRRVLVGRFTHWGDSRNFVQYAYRASRELQSPEIKRQLRNHVTIFDRHWKKMVTLYYN